jgi:hypothetical protein
MTVAGASQFRNAATLANTQGIAAQTTTLLGSGTDTSSLLEAGRSVNAGLVGGLSSSARAINQSLLSRSGDVNTLFSLGAGGDATIDGARQQILALRAGLSDAQLSRGLRADAAAASDEPGQVVDTTV